MARVHVERDVPPVEPSRLRARGDRVHLCPPRGRSWGRHPAAQTPTRVALAVLQRLEIDLAVRGIDCNERARGLDEAVRLEHEARFIDENHIALDDIKARAVALDEALGLTTGD